MHVAQHKIAIFKVLDFRQSFEREMYSVEKECYTIAEDYIYWNITILMDKFSYRGKEKRILWTYETLKVWNQNRK